VKAISKKPTRLRTLWSWLQPGLGIKRWIALLVVGIFLTALGISLGASALSGDPTFVSTNSLPIGVVVGLILLAGLTASLIALFRLNNSLLSPYVTPGKPVVEVVARHRRLGRGPKIVAIGGGTGLSTLLRGLKTHTGNLTAIVTMADDGGSSGRLRKSLGLPPPGDLRSCLAALSDDEDLLTHLFQYRFLEGEELEGHSFGNLFIAALSGVTGSFDRGILEAGRVLAIRGRVLPSTLADVSLSADKTPFLESRAIRVQGESHIPEVPGQIRRVYLEPSDPPAYPEAIHALLNADMIVIGPGSLYTSVMPNLLVPDIAGAVQSSRAFRVYVCNVATQKGETDNYDCEAHWTALSEHASEGLVDVVVANDCLDVKLPQGVSLVTPPDQGLKDVPFYAADLIDHQNAGRHESHHLAEVLISLLEERTGPLEWPKAEQVERVSELN
jgi:uncharacterized cofD-like protein